MKKLKYFTRLVIAFFCATVSPVHADVSLVLFETNHGRYHRIVIHDEIKPGDYDVFLRTVDKVWRETTDSQQYVFGNFDIILNSTGGDVLEAMRIGNAVREMAITVSVPSAILFGDWDMERGFFREPEFDSGEAGYLRRKSLETAVRCYSACFLVYIAAVNRSFDFSPITYDNPHFKSMGREWIDNANREDSAKMSPVGIHRPYFETRYFAGLSSTEARKRYSELEEAVRTYLTSMGLGERWISDMFSVPSNEVKRLSFGDLVSIGRMDPAWQEWLISRCGFSHLRDALLAFDKDALQCLSERVPRERAHLKDAYLEKHLANSPE